MNSKNRKTSEPHILILNLTDKLDLRKSIEKSIALSNLSIYYTWKNVKDHKIKIYLKYQLQHGMKNLDYQLDNILSLIFRINTSIF